MNCVSVASAARKSPRFHQFSGERARRAGPAYRIRAMVESRRDGTLGLARIAGGIMPRDMLSIITLTKQTTGPNIPT